MNILRIFFWLIVAPLIIGLSAILGGMILGGLAVIWAIVFS